MTTTSAESWVKAGFPWRHGTCAVKCIDTRLSCTRLGSRIR